MTETSIASNTPTTTAPETTWDRYWANVGSEEWLTAKALIELSRALRAEAETWVDADGRDGILAWIRDVDDNGRGWSSTEHRLFNVVAALIDPYPDVYSADEIRWGATAGDGQVRRTIPLVYCLELMGSWEGDFWRILTEWGTGGNNREYPGRSTVVTR